MFCYTIPIWAHLLYIFIIFSLSFISFILFKYLKPSNLSNPPKVIISFEGNIASGKTSMMELFKERFGESSAEFVVEPVDEWKQICDDDGNNILQVFYTDKLRWSYTFQNIAYITRLTLLMDKIKNSKKQYIFLDRSLKSDKNIFSKMLHDDKFINTLEWSAYNKWNNFYETYIKGDNNMIHKMIYVRCEPDISYQRLQIRNREEEKDITYEYLASVHKYHEDWLPHENNVLIIDVNKNFVKNQAEFDKIYDSILNYIKN